MATGRTRMNAPIPQAHAPATATPVASALPQGSGRPLDGAVRNWFEPRFGHDFGHVRIHTDERSASAAAALHAQAYSLGEHIVFARGRYAPGTQDGRALIAHELMHSLQSPGPVAAVGSLARADAGAEAQADAAAAAQGLAPGTRPLIASQPQLALQEEDGDDQALDDQPTPPLTDLAQRDRLAGTVISRIVANVGNGRVAFIGKNVTIFGTVSTDLGPGKYTIHADYARKRWVIEDPVVAVGQRFSVTLEGAIPWTLAYPERLQLVVGASQEWTQGPPPDDELNRLELQDEAAPTVTDEQRDIDSFDTCSYHLDYRSQGGNASKWLRCTYASGRSVDIHLDWIHDGSTPQFDKPLSLASLDDLRVPAELTASTAPRLSAAKKTAINTMYEQVLTVMDHGMLAYSIASMGLSVPMGAPVRASSIRTGAGRPARAGARIGPSLDAEVDTAFNRLQDGNNAGTGKEPIPQQPGVRLPASRNGEPVEVLSVGAGRQRKSDLGLPEDVVNITRSDLESAKPDVVLDATKAVPAEQIGRSQALIINNPHGYVPNIAELAKALKPGGKIIVQSSWKANKYFRALGTGPVPEGMTRTIERDVQVLGRGFGYTDPARAGAPVPDSRITFELKAVP